MYVGLNMEVSMESTAAIMAYGWDKVYYRGNGRKLNFVEDGKKLGLLLREYTIGDKKLLVYFTLSYAFICIPKEDEDISIERVISELEQGIIDYADFFSGYTNIAEVISYYDFDVEEVVAYTPPELGYMIPDAVLYDVRMRVETIFDTYHTVKGIDG